MAYVDLTRLRGLTPRGRTFLESLKVGDPVGIHASYGLAEVIANGFVRDVGDGRVHADFTHLTKQPGRLLEQPRQAFDAPTGRKVAPAELRTGQQVWVVDKIARGYMLAALGVVSAIYDGSTKICPANVEIGGTLTFRWPDAGVVVLAGG